MDKVSAGKCLELAGVLAQQIKEKNLDFELIIGLSTGGLVAAAMVAKRLEGVDSSKVIGLSVHKHDRVYLIDDRYVDVRNVEGASILLIDDASNFGDLLNGGAMDLWERGAAQVVTAALVANVRGFMPDLFASTCVGEPPDFFWE